MAGLAGLAGAAGSASPAGAGLAAASALAGAAAGGPSSAELTGRLSINIAPTGLNLGEVLNQFNQGAPTNGGSGVPSQSRWFNSARTSNLSLGRPAGPLAGLDMNVILIGAAVSIAGIAGIFLLRRK